MDLSAVRLEAERLVLRELSETDVEQVHEYASDPEVVSMLTWGPNTLEQTRDFVQRAIEERKQEPRLCFTLGIELKEDERLVGACRLVIPLAKERTGKITYVLNKAYWRRGLMAEAARELLRFGFETVKLNRIVGTSPAANWGSALVLEKIGMKKEGRYDEHLRDRDGKWIAANVHAATRSGWPPPA